MTKLLSITLLVFVATKCIAESNLLSRLESYRTTQSYSCGKTCGQVRSCKEAVYQWCICGYSRADGDNDGVPCEKVCGQSTPGNVSNVRSIRRELGC
ncbi:excalibur calcium-binding domain-containing protein [Tritonibacter mobilis]|nr:excalibur calcium-binding domain-containing protein [Tritonibacter mobilis]MCA2008867.1 excalibur calcium-binding domain-containing protein [Tritonibacter mobilis]NHM20542.1 excalibur calcium-binding domain-containing protein [Tritonibacter mobilis]NHM24704.1 excalibur calcium-binding domain-containing protein [Tritonibacter mobilis]